jgi:hypothetical protein
MPERTYQPNILEILRTIIYEKNHPLLEGKIQNSKFIAGNRLSLRFSLLQLALVDIGLLFSLAQLAAGSVKVLDYSFYFLIILNLIVVVLLYVIVYRANRNVTKEDEGHWYSLYFLYCKNCDVGTIDKEDVILHKLDNPEHTIGKYNVRVRILEMSRFMDVFRIYEIMPLLFLPLIIALLGNIFNITLLKEFFLLAYAPLIFLYVYRRLKRWSKGNALNFLKIKIMKRDTNNSLDIITMKFISIDIRYLNAWESQLSNSTILINSDGKPVILIDGYKIDRLGNIRISGYRGLPPGLHNL